MVISFSFEVEWAVAINFSWDEVEQRRLILLLLSQDRSVVCVAWWPRFTDPA